MSVAVKQLAASARPTGDHLELASPSPGTFRAVVAVGDLVRAGQVLGDLDVLGRITTIVAPPDAHGAVIAVADPARARAAVAFGTALVTLDPAALGAAAATGAAAAAAAAGTEGLVFRAPTSGRFYSRSAPDNPPFITLGAELTVGTTVGLLEVMKTFNRLTYGGAGLPERARIDRILVADGDDVNAGDPLLALT